MTTTQRIGVRVPGGPKKPKSNRDLIILIVILLLFALNLFFFSGCASQPCAGGSEPATVTPPQAGSLEEVFIFDFPYRGHQDVRTTVPGVSSEPIQPPPCDHFFVSQAFPVDSTSFDPYILEVIDQIRRADGLACICVYCKKIEKCY